MDTAFDEDSARLTFWLFYSARSVTAAYAEVLRAHCEERSKAYIVTPPQWGALSLLLVQDGMTIGTMSQKRGVDAPAVTGIITRLEQIGLVDRRHDRGDRRLVKVYLTEEGSDIAHTLVAVVDHFAERLNRGFAEDELNRFLAHLQQLIANASEIGGGGEDRFGLLAKAALANNEGIKE